MIYAYYVVLLLILIAGIKFSGFKEFSDQFMSQKQCKAIQGMCAVLIIFHHMSQTLEYYKPTKCFVDVGILFVGVFFFCSGYGLIKSLKEKEGYLNGFLKKRLITVLVPFWLISGIYLIYSAVIGMYDGMSVTELAKEMLLGITGIKIANGNEWYIIVITFLYVFFYFLFKYCKEAVAFVVLGILILAYCFAGLYLDHGECIWWLQGEWWYNTVILFYVGLLFARFEEPILKGLKKGYYIILPVTIVAAVFAMRFSKDVLYERSYWCEYIPMITRKQILMNRSMCFGTQTLAIILFILAVLMVMLKFRFGNPVLNFLGKISLELYLIHDLFIQFYHSEYCNLTKSIEYITAVVLSSIAAAFILWLLVSRINKVLWKKKL